MSCIRLHLNMTSAYLTHTSHMHKRMTYRVAPQPLLRSRATHRRSAVPCASSDGGDVMATSDAHASTSTPHGYKNRSIAKCKVNSVAGDRHRREEHRHQARSEATRAAYLCRVTVLSVHGRHRVVLYAWTIRDAQGEEMIERTSRITSSVPSNAGASLRLLFSAAWAVRCDWRPAARSGCRTGRESHRDGVVLPSVVARLLQLLQQT